MNLKKIRYQIDNLFQTRINQQRELTVVGEFIKKYLIKHALISEQNWVRSNFLPTVVDVRQIDRMANPAINEKDWRTIHNFVRNQSQKKLIILRNQSDDFNVSTL